MKPYVGKLCGLNLYGLYPRISCHLLMHSILYYCHMQSIATEISMCGDRYAS